MLSSHPLLMIVRSTWQKAVYRLLCRYRTRHFIESDSAPFPSSSKRTKAARTINSSTAENARGAKDNRSKQKLNDQGLTDQYVMVDPSDAQEDPPILPPVRVTALDDDDGATWIFSQIAERLDPISGVVPRKHCVGQESPPAQLILEELQSSDAPKHFEEIAAHRRSDSKSAKENRRRRRSSKFQRKGPSSTIAEKQVTPDDRDKRGHVIPVGEIPI